MKFVLAPDSFKGSLTAAEVCVAMERGVRMAWPDADILAMPMADGGEGTVDSMILATGGVKHQVHVTGPLGDPVEAYFGILGDGQTAVIEMAQASGLPLLPEDRRNPLVTTTYGTGELIACALDKGCRNIMIAIGGSATNDAGAGMAEALGVRFSDRGGRSIPRGGGGLAHLASIDVTGLDDRLAGTNITVLCDVDNPLCGPDGASVVFGPQKGATADVVRVLDHNLEHFAEVVKDQLGVDVKDEAGAGAAGGLGYACVAILNAKLRRGAESVMDATRFDDALHGADLVITGEGRCDAQTLRGKTPFAVAARAKSLGIPVICLAGSVDIPPFILQQHGISAAFSIVDRPMELSEAVARVSELIERSAMDVVLAVRALQRC